MSRGRLTGPPSVLTQALLPAITTSITITGNCTTGSDPFNGKCLLDGAGLGAWGLPAGSACTLYGEGMLRCWLAAARSEWHPDK